MMISRISIGDHWLVKNSSYPYMLRDILLISHIQYHLRAEAEVYQSKYEITYFYIDTKET